MKVSAVGEARDGEADDRLISKVAGMRSMIMKDLYVFTMARATPNRPGSKTRALNAARRLDAMFREYGSPTEERIS